MYTPGVLTPTSARKAAMSAFESMGFGPEWRAVVTDAVNGDIELRLDFLMPDEEPVNDSSTVVRTHPLAFTEACSRQWGVLKQSIHSPRRPAQAAEEPNRMTRVVLSEMYRAEVEAGLSVAIRPDVEYVFSPYVPAYAPIGPQPLWKRVARSLKLMAPPKRYAQAFVLDDEGRAQDLSTLPKYEPPPVVEAVPPAEAQDLMRPRRFWNFR